MAVLASQAGSRLAASEARSDSRAATRTGISDLAWSCSARAAADLRTNAWRRGVARSRSRAGRVCGALGAARSWRRRARWSSVVRRLGMRASVFGNCFSRPGDRLVSTLYCAED